MESTNGDMPAMPMDSTSAQRADEGHYDQFSYGLTKREHFAAMAMQKLAPRACDISQHHPSQMEMAAKAAVDMADALLEALEAKA